MYAPKIEQTLHKLYTIFFSNLWCRRQITRLQKNGWFKQTLSIFNIRGSYSQKMKLRAKMRAHEIKPSTRFPLGGLVELWMFKSTPKSQMLFEIELHGLKSNKTLIFNFLKIVMLWWKRRCYSSSRFVAVYIACCFENMIPHTSETPRKLWMKVAHKFRDDEKFEKQRPKGSKQTNSIDPST